MLELLQKGQQYIHARTLEAKRNYKVQIDKNKQPSEDGTLQSPSTEQKVATGVIGTIVGIVIFVPLGIVAIIAGLLLTMTIIGAIIGIPLIFIGLATMIMGPFGGLAAFTLKKAKCPYCQTVLQVNARSALNCRVCKKRSFVKDGKLELVI